MARVFAGSFQIVQHLGTGAMGHVFLAKHVSSGLQAAVKILPFGSSPAQKLRFAEEARLLSEQEHPNIVQLWDVGTLGDASRYLVMEYAPAMSLEAWLDCGEVRSSGRMLRVLRQVARAIDRVHARSMVHRDIKPANIMIDPAG